MVFIGETRVKTNIPLPEISILPHLTFTKRAGWFPMDRRLRYGQSVDREGGEAAREDSAGRLS
jgi:hypothetical protein